MRKLLVIAVALAVAPALFASDAEKGVMKAAYEIASRSAAARGGAPSIVRMQTTGAADGFASQWAVIVRGKAVGEELGKSYQSNNAQAANIKDLLPDLKDKDVIDVSEPYNWRHIDKFEPGHQSLLVFSRPAIDSTGSVALVRVDIVPHDSPPSTIFYELEHQSDDTWKVGRATVTGYDASRRPDFKLQ